MLRAALNLHSNRTMIERLENTGSLSDLFLMTVASFVCAAVFILLLTPLARSVNLVDEPNERKQHDSAIPVVGGLSIAVSLTGVLIWAGALNIPAMVSFLGLGVILAFLGFLDDFSHIRMRYRLVVQIVVGLALCFVADLKILSLGDLFGGGSVTLGVLAAVAFTVACSVGVYNSINMIDGLDGLAGIVVSISALAMASIAYAAGDSFSAGVLLSTMGAIAAYLLFNLSVFGASRKVFMGDAGSLFLGFLLLWFFIYLSQGEQASLSPVAAGWIFGLPLADTIAVIVGRLVRGLHPLAAGRDHIHHRLLNYGFSNLTVLAILALYHGSLVAVGVFCNGKITLEPFLFWGFVTLTVIHFIVLFIILPRLTPTSRNVVA